MIALPMKIEDNKINVDTAESVFFIMVDAITWFKWSNWPSLKIFSISKLTTVKLGYNELGYNELPVITNKFSPFFQSQIHA